MSPRRHHVAKGAMGDLDEGRVTPGPRVPPDGHRDGRIADRPLLRSGSSVVSEGITSSLDGARATPEQTNPVRSADSVRSRKKPKEIIVGFFNQVATLKQYSIRHPANLASEKLIDQTLVLGRY